MLQSGVFFIKWDVTQWNSTDKLINIVPLKHWTVQVIQRISAFCWNLFKSDIEFSEGGITNINWFDTTWDFMYFEIISKIFIDLWFSINWDYFRILKYIVKILKKTTSYWGCNTNVWENIRILSQDSCWNIIYLRELICVA